MVLGSGAVAAGQPWLVGVLLASTALSAAYFLPPPPDGLLGEDGRSRRERLFGFVAIALWAAEGQNRSDAKLPRSRGFD
ncbi:MAG TPA: hypothetical protein VK447_03570 [Myxococcaceae bacterium]|nr:hypothetical protein [Myxococcaceae bacterium]